MNDVLLSIDCGTQSIRCHLFAANGRILASRKVAYPPYTSPRPGWAEQDPELFWKGLCEATTRLKDSVPDLFARIAGIGVTAQRDTMICMDADGNSLRPAITWLDQRKARPVWTPNPVVDFALGRLGLRNTIHKAQTDGKCNWIMQHEPEIWQETHRYMQVAGFLQQRLTGRFADSVAGQIGHIPFDYKKQAWAGKWNPSRWLFPVSRAKLPELVAPGTPIGNVTEKAARATGLKSGIPVIACGSDKGCETIGMGIRTPDRASLSFGTTATIQTTSARYFEPIANMPAYPAPIPGHYNPEVEIFRGYWMITWFKSEFGHPEAMEALDQGVPPEILLNRLLETTPPGATGLMLQPFWSPDLEHPEGKGAMIGFGDVHTRAHVYRAVIEGLAYALLDGLHCIEKRGRTTITELAVSGGASQSDQICQISADIFERPLVRGETCETSGLGAALITSVGIGLHPDFRSAMDSMIRTPVVFRPNPEHAALYRKLYRNVYSRMYEALEPLYREIRNITGYPAISAAP